MLCLLFILHQCKIVMKKNVILINVFVSHPYVGWKIPLKGIKKNYCKNILLMWKYLRNSSINDREGIVKDFCTSGG